MMLGYATNEIEKVMPESKNILMPLSHYLASQLCAKIREVRQKKILPWLHVDAKSQVTIEYAKKE